MRGLPYSANPWVGRSDCPTCPSETGGSSVSRLYYQQASCRSAVASKTVCYSAQALGAALPKRNPQRLIEWLFAVHAPERPAIVFLRL